jgi:hypothetical protein
MGRGILATNGPRGQVLLDGFEGLTQGPLGLIRLCSSSGQLFDIEISKGVEGQATDFLEDGVGRVSLEDSLLLKAAGSGLELVEDLESHGFVWWSSHWVALDWAAHHTFSQGSFVDTMKVMLPSRQNAKATRPWSFAFFLSFWTLLREPIAVPMKMIMKIAATIIAIILGSIY